MLWEFFERAFFHVLKDDTKEKSGEDLFKYHRSMDLAQAVEVFHERQDSKRSDEFFISQFKILIDQNEKLRDDFLYLPGKKAADEAEEASQPEKPLPSEASSPDNASEQPESPGDESPG